MNVYPILTDNEEQASVIVARTSRSPLPFSTIAEEVKQRGYKEFIKTNVLGYGHDSVAEGAMAPWIAIEGVSDLAGNVIATADPLLRVQMTSTRYQDMSTRGVVNDPTGGGQKMLDAYGALHAKIDELLVGTDHPRKRTLGCDIARWFIPAGVRTQLAIRGDARTMRDTVAYLSGHPLEEVREVADKLRQTLKPLLETLFDRHITPRPYAVRASDPIPNVFYGLWANYGGGSTDPDDLPHLYDLPIALGRWKDSGYRLRPRPTSCPESYWTAELTSDYGAYRDLRRHRTLHQTDLLPLFQQSPVVTDPLRVFRIQYADLCAQISELPEYRQAIDAVFEANDDSKPDPYMSPMGTPMHWLAGGHALNWAYALRLRTAPGTHPGYSVPMRCLLKHLPENIRTCMGVVLDDAAFIGVEFEDRLEAANVTA